MQLDEIRTKIDETDDRLCALFTERMALAAEVAAYKAENKMPVLNPKRERDIITRVTGNVPEEMADYTKVLMQTLFDLSRSYQTSLLPHKSTTENKIKDALLNTPQLFPERATVACQGTEGAYSQKACEKIFHTPDIMYFDSFRGVCAAVDSGLASYGILPVENSLHGSVSDVYDLMREYKFYIIRAHKLQIHHTLLTKEPCRIEDIREVYSHEQAIGQCESFLKSHHIKVHKCENTAIAAQMVAQSDRTDIAAIASRDCAAVFGLSIVAEDIQNSDNNYTRFICISKDLSIYPGASKLSLMVSLPHRAGSLYAMISKFSALGINLSKIESVPIPGHSFAFRFYLDMEVSVYSPALATLITDLENSTEDFAFLGCYTEN